MRGQKDSYSDATNLIKLLICETVKIKNKNLPIFLDSTNKCNINRFMYVLDCHNRISSNDHFYKPVKSYLTSRVVC